MSYLKLPLAIQDYPVGFRSINQADDNAAAIRSHLDTRHALGNDGFTATSFTNPLDEIGRHDDVRIARAVASFYVDTSRAFPVLRARFMGPVFGSLQVTRRAVGQWQIYLAAPLQFAGVPQMRATATVDYRATSYRVIDPVRGPSVIVSTWQLSGSWALADLPFDLPIWLNR